MRSNGAWVISRPEHLPPARAVWRSRSSIQPTIAVTVSSSSRIRRPSLDVRPCSRKLVRASSAKVASQFAQPPVFSSALINSYSSRYKRVYCVSVNL